MDQIKRVLIAIDDGPAAGRIAQAARHLVQQLNAEVALVSVVDTTALMTEGAVTPGELVNSMHNDLKKKQQMILDTVFTGEKVWSFVEKGKPYEMILNVARDWQAGLVVLGTHGRTGLSHLLMGSVAEKVIRHSTIPLYVIPTRND